MFQGVLSRVACMAVLLAGLSASVAWADSRAELVKASALHQAAKMDEAKAAYAVVLANPQATIEQKHAAQRGLGEICISKRDNAGAIEAFEKTVKEYSRLPDGKLLPSYYHASCLLGNSYSNAGRTDDALRIFEEVARSAPEATQAFAHNGIATIHIRQNKTKEGLAHLLAAYRCNAEGQVGVAAGHLERIVRSANDLTAIIDDPQDVYAVLTAGIARNALNPQICEKTLQALTRILVGMGEYSGAMYETRILLETSSTSPIMQEAADRLTLCLKATDGSLHRVNKLLEYQKYGLAGPDKQRGTADDLIDPLTDLKPYNAQVRDKIFAEALGLRKNDWEGRIGKAAVLRYWGKPVEALKELKVAFALCPVRQEALQKVTDHIVVCLVQVSGDPDAGAAFVSFQKLGPAGADGQTGTADDLKNPMDQYLNPS